MTLPLHEVTHVFFSLTVGLLVWKLFKKPVAVFTASFIGGFLVDFDHLFDYFLAFGTNFNLTYFLKGYAFFKTDKIYVFFHAWEWVIITLLLFLLLRWTAKKNKKAQLLSICLLSFSLSLLLHLSIDVITNNVQARSYFLLYRLNNNFQLKTMVTSEHYQKHLQQKKQVIY